MKKSIFIVLLSLLFMHCASQDKTFTGSYIKTTVQESDDGSFVSTEFKGSDGKTFSFVEPTETFMADEKKKKELTSQGASFGDITNKGNIGKSYAINYLINDAGQNNIKSFGEVGKQSKLIVQDKFKTCKIGNSEWMVQNLSVSKYHNGDIIPQVQDPEEWSKLNTGAWCYYQDITANGIKYGKLYNWYAVNDPRGLAPDGWHIPSREEWQELVKYLGGEQDSPIKLKNNTGWEQKNEDFEGNPEYNGTNESGFSALPGGSRNSVGLDAFIDIDTKWWSSSEFCQVKDQCEWAWYCRVYYEPSSNTSIQKSSKSDGLSLRCVKDK